MKWKTVNKKIHKTLISMKWKGLTRKLYIISCPQSKRPLDLYL